MPETDSFHNSENAKAWLGQFEPEDQVLAQELLKSFLLVSRDEFVQGLRELILEEANKVYGSIALYAEREVGESHHVPHKLFEEDESEEGQLRAVGAGPQPIKPVKPYDRGVGSEGIVAQLINDLCRESPSKFLNHPGPNLIRRRKIRGFWIITDLIGSGERAEKYIRAAWRVRSVRSWWSGKFLSFRVFGYAATSFGKRFVESHHSQPEVHYLVPCPTIAEKFGVDRKFYFDLCEQYDPNRDDHPIWGGGGLGHNNTGALIAFAHGAPNNVPEIFHKTDKKKQWIPLFPSRVASGLPPSLFGQSFSQDAITQRLNALGQDRLIPPLAERYNSEEVQARFLVIAALLKAPRNEDMISTRTGFNKLKISKILHVLHLLNWIDDRNRLTDTGYAELRAFEQSYLNPHLHAEETTVDYENKPYYPSSLRFPMKESS